jgi:hypothetical protein
VVLERGDAEYPFVKALTTVGSEIDGITMLVAIYERRHQHWSSTKARRGLKDARGHRAAVCDSVPRDRSYKDRRMKQEIKVRCIDMILMMGCMRRDGTGRGEK